MGKSMPWLRQSLTLSPITFQNDNLNILGLNSTVVDFVNQKNDECGYTEFMENALTYPPKGLLPTAPDSSKGDCNTWNYIVSAAIYINPCFNIYHILDYCPYLWDELGFPSFGKTVSILQAEPC